MIPARKGLVPGPRKGQKLNCVAAVRFLESLLAKPDGFGSGRTSSTQSRRGKKGSSVLPECFCRGTVHVAASLIVDHACRNMLKL